MTNDDRPYRPASLDGYAGFAEHKGHLVSLDETPDGEIDLVCTECHEVILSQFHPEDEAMDPGPQVPLVEELLNTLENELTNSDWTFDGEVVYRAVRDGDRIRIVLSDEHGNHRNLELQLVQRREPMPSSDNMLDEAIVWQEHGGEWHVASKGDSGAPALADMDSPKGYTGSMEVAQDAVVVFEIDSQGHSRNLKNRWNVRPEEVLAQELMSAVRKIEFAYSDILYVRDKLLGIDRRKLNVSQEVATLLSMQDAGRPYPVARVQTNSLGPSEEHGLTLDCTILDGSAPASFINESIFYMGRLYRITKVVSERSDAKRVAFQVFEEAPAAPRHEPINAMVQNTGGFPIEKTITGRWPSEPTPPHVHAMSHENRQRYERRGLFASEVVKRGFEKSSLLTHDYKDLEIRIFALALKEMGLGEWFHELMELVCFPECDDFVYVRDSIKVHLNDERVAFLHEGKPEAVSEDDKSVAAEILCTLENELCNHAWSFNNRTLQHLTHEGAVRILTLTDEQGNTSQFEVSVKKRR